MKTILTAAALVLGSTILCARPTHACTSPSEEAGNPSVEPGGEVPPGGEPGAEVPPDGNTGGGEPGVDMPTPGGSAGGDQPGSDPSATPPGDVSWGGDESIGGPSADELATFTPEPGGVGTTPAALVAVTWTPGADTDADPNESAFFRHDGHRIETRIVIQDRVTKNVVLEEHVPQYDYGTATRDNPGSIHTRFEARLPPGEYIARVQSVFHRHDEIRFGLDGRWMAADEVTEAPAISDSVAGVAFKVSPLAAESLLSDGSVGGGCSSTGKSDGVAALATLMILGLARRRRARI